MGAVPIPGVNAPWLSNDPKLNPIGAAGRRFGGWVGDMFSGPKLPAMREPPPQAPDATDGAIQAARSAEILRQRMMRGASSSLLTGPTGLTSPPPIATKSLLGS